MWTTTRYTTERTFIQKSLKPEFSSRLHYYIQQLPGCCGALMVTHLWGLTQKDSQEALQEIEAWGQKHKYGAVYYCARRASGEREFIL